MSVKDIPHHKLVEVAKYLDDFPPSRANHDDEMGEEQYWVLFIKELKRVPKVGKRFSYTNVQIVDFGDDRKGRSPSLKLLYDLQEKKLELDTFVYCLQKINCTGAMNVFRDATPPVITQHPEPQTLKRGETIVLVVDAKCDPGPPQFQWFKGEMPLMGEKSSKLVIYGAHRGNSGFYCCRVRNPFINDEQKANVFSQWTRVEVEEQGVLQARSPIRQEVGTPLREEALPQYPLITLQPSPLTVDYRSKAVLECRAEGAVVFDWLKNGKPYRQGAKDGRLVFETAMMEDGGEYQCVVVNDRGRVKSTSVRLTVESVIEILEQPADVSGRVGGEITLYCRARRTKDGDKKLVYQWFEEGGDPSARDREIGSEEELRAKLNLKSHKVLRVYCIISLPEDREVCARSRTARITANTVWFTRQPESIEGYLGHHYCLICEAEGLGNITYVWLKSSTKDGRKDRVKKSKTVSIDDGTLTFQALGQNDWGYYTCQAQNDQNYIDSRTVRVSVGPRTGNEREVKRPVVRVTKQPRSQVVPEQGEFRLTCRAVSTEDEPLQYQWYYSGSMLTGSTQETLVRTNISAEHYGSYYCEVKTNSGMGREVSQSARIEPASVSSEWNLRGRAGVQLQQLEAERTMMTARKERYALEKVALLIGNQKYESPISPLLSPENDIRELHKLLEAPHLNFKVISLVNLTFREMMKALETFYEMLAVPGVYALFYYSGHGFSFQGSTYLVPVDATLPLMCENNIEANAIGMNMQKKMSRAIVVLDCCRISKDEIPTPQTSLTSLTSFANHIEISSCMDNTVALESKMEPYSTFNIAFRRALAEKTIIHNVFTSVNDALRKAELSLNGDPYQRPNYKGSFADNDITLHDAVMMDDPKKEEQLDKIHHYWQLSQTLPDSLLLSGPGDLAGVMNIDLSFSPEFSNVLLVAITVKLLQENSTCTAINLDKPFLERQDVHGELSSEVNPAMLRITNIQRLQQNLKLILKFSVTVDGERKEGSIIYELPQKTLFACLLELSS